MYESLNNRIFKTLLSSYLNGTISKQDLETRIPNLDPTIIVDAQKIVDVIDSGCLIPNTILMKL